GELPAGNGAAGAGGLCDVRRGDGPADGHPVAGRWLEPLRRHRSALRRRSRPDPDRSVLLPHPRLDRAAMSHEDRLRAREAELAARDPTFRGRFLSGLRADPSPGPGAEPPLPPPFPAEPPLPPLVQKAAGLVGALAGVARATARGEPVLAPQDVQDARLATCREGRGLAPDQVRDGRCDKYRPSDDRCSVCGCYLAG